MVVGLVWWSDQIVFDRFSQWRMRWKFPRWCELSQLLMVSVVKSDVSVHTSVFNGSCASDTWLFSEKCWTCWREWDKAQDGIGHVKICSAIHVTSNLFSVTLRCVPQCCGKQTRDTSMPSANVVHNTISDTSRRQGEPMTRAAVSFMYCFLYLEGETIHPWQSLWSLLQAWATSAARLPPHECE